MKLHAIVDLSGSMSVLGKKAICDMVLQTIAFLPEFELERHDWDGNEPSLNEILAEVGNEPVVILSDGYAISDSKLQVPEHTPVILCGSDSMRYIKNVDVYSAEDTVKFLEILQKQTR